jgi:hypothetical protein
MTTLFQSLTSVVAREAAQAFRTALWVLPLTILALTGIARAADIPVAGTFGTVAMCVIDAFTDIPSPEINYNVGGAPLARVMAGEFDTPTQSCVFQRIVSQSATGPKQSWVVQADCDAGTGKATHVLTIASDKQAQSVSVSAEDGKVLATLDLCSLPYAERLSRELKRMPPAKK